MLKLIKPKRYSDNRGFFGEIYNRKRYLGYGIVSEFVQDNHSVSKQIGTLRGLHFQAPPRAQGKLVRCSKGAIYDVAVDIRMGSPTYGNWEGYELTADNGHQLYIPKGYAHGFLTLMPYTEIAYKCTDYYAPETEGCIIWNDPELLVNWPIKDNLILSDKDLKGTSFKNFLSPFVYGVNS